MARVANVEIPNNKRGEISLTYIFGIGRSTAKRILTETKISLDKKVSDWTDEEFRKIRQSISESCTVEGELKRILRNSKDRLNYIGCLRGIRLRQGTTRTRTKNQNQCQNKKRRQKNSGQQKESY